MHLPDGGVWFERVDKQLRECNIAIPLLVRGDDVPRRLQKYNEKTTYAGSTIKLIKTRKVK